LAEKQSKKEKERNMVKNTEDKPQQVQEGLTNVLVEVVHRLKSQPLLFGLGIVLLLVILASFAIDALHAILIPATLIFVIGVFAWMINEYLRIKAKDVDVEAHNVGKRGSVKGVTGLENKYSPPKTKVKADKIDGIVIGVEYAQEKKRGGGK
jgi:Mg2+/citrate symporter